MESRMETKEKQRRRGRGSEIEDGEKREAKEEITARQSKGESEEEDETWQTVRNGRERDKIQSWK